MPQERYKYIWRNSSLASYKRLASVVMWRRTKAAGDCLSVLLILPFKVFKARHHRRIGSESERVLLPSVFAHTRNSSWCQELPVQREKKIHIFPRVSGGYVCTRHSLLRPVEKNLDFFFHVITLFRALKKSFSFFFFLIIFHSYVMLCVHWDSI